MNELLQRAETAVGSIDLGLAQVLYDAAEMLSVSQALAARGAEALAGSGYVAHLRGDNSIAIARYDAALAIIDDTELRTLVRMRRAFAQYDSGDLDLAETGLKELLVETPNSPNQARVKGYLGNVARAAGRHHQASGYYSEAIAQMRTFGDTRFAAVFAMDRAVDRLLANRADIALAELSRLATDQAVVDDPLLQPLTAHYRSLALASLGLPSAPVDAGKLHVAEYLASVREVLLSPRASRVEELQHALPPNGHASASLSIALAALHRKDSPAFGLRVARQGTFFRLGDDPLVTLTAQGPLARIVAHLAVSQLERPGTCTTVEQLGEIAWPHERLTPQSLKNRVHVAVATLRKLGLRPVLSLTTGGYCIVEDARTVIVD